MIFHRCFGTGLRCFNKRPFLCFGNSSQLGALFLDGIDGRIGPVGVQSNLGNQNRGAPPRQVLRHHVVGGQHTR